MNPSAEWYRSLRQSRLTPPPWVFPIVWSILYLTMAVSAGIYIHSGGLSYWPGIVFFVIQLVLNLSWSPAFFRYQRTGLSLMICISMWIFILLTIIEFKKISPTAGNLLIPYLVWVSLATYLNAYIWLNN